MDSIRSALSAVFKDLKSRLSTSRQTQSKDTCKTKEPVSIVKNWPLFTVIHHDEMFFKRYPNRQREVMIKPPEWMDLHTRIGFSSNGDPTTVLVSCHWDKPEYGRKIALVTESKPYSLTSLPDLPERVHFAVVFHTGKHVYVVGGLRYNDQGAQYRSNKVDRLCLQTKEWDSCPTLLKKVYGSLKLVHQGKLYVLGCYLGRLRGSKKMQRYDIEKSEWCMLSDIPHGVHSGCSGPRVLHGKIVVVTKKNLMRYDLTSDTWQVDTFKKQPKKLGCLLFQEEHLAMVDVKTGEREVYDEKERKWYDHE